MKRLNVLYEKQRIGQLLEADGIHYFQYDVRYLPAPLPLSPFKLPPLPDASAHKLGYFYNLPGLIYDSQETNGVATGCASAANATNCEQTTFKLWPNSWDWMTKNSKQSWAK